MLVGVEYRRMRISYGFVLVEVMVVVDGGQPT